MREAELALVGGKVLDVFSGELREVPVAIAEGKVVGFGEYGARKRVDLGGQVMVPGLIDGHCHIESSLLSVGEFSRLALASGTTAVVADPHEIANVWGVEGVRYLLEQGRAAPLDIYLMAPSCVPSCEFESSGAKLGAEEVKECLWWEGVIGLGEVMDVGAVLRAEGEMMGKLEAAGERPIDGHCPGLGGNELDAYIAAGITTDHECLTVEEAREKVGKGMYVQLREGTASQDVRRLAAAVEERNWHRFMFCTDDRHAEEILEEGHLLAGIRAGIEAGIEPATAFRMATLVPAICYGLRGKGGIHPGADADLVVLDSLAELNVRRVFKGGREVVRAAGGQPRAGRPTVEPLKMRGITREDLRITGKTGSVRAIEVVVGSILTEERVVKAKVWEGQLVSDVEKDVLKIAMAERHRRTGRVGVGFVCGFGLKEGAIASSVAHDAHNVIGVGVSDGGKSLGKPAAAHCRPNERPASGGSC